MPGVFICCGCGARNAYNSNLESASFRRSLLLSPAEESAKSMVWTIQGLESLGRSAAAGFFLSSSATPEQQPLPPEIPWGETDSSIVERQLTLYSAKHSRRALLLLIHKRFYLLFFFSRNFQPIQLHSRTLYIYLFK